MAEYTDNMFAASFTHDPRVYPKTKLDETLDFNQNLSGSSCEQSSPGTKSNSSSDNTSGSETLSSEASGSDQNGSSSDSSKEEMKE